MPRPASSGPCYLGVFADHRSQLRELNETNNVSRLTGRCELPADIVVSAVQFLSGQRVAGGVARYRATVTNRGGLATGAFDVAWIVGKGGTRLTLANGIQIATPQRVANLSPSQSIVLSIAVRVPYHYVVGTRGSTLIAAYADAFSRIAELDESNNQSTLTTTYSNYTGTRRSIEHVSRVSGAASSYARAFLALRSGPRRVTQEITAPNLGRHWYMCLWSGSNTFQIDALTNLGISLLNSPIFPHWFGQLDATGRTSVRKPSMNLPNTPIRSTFTAYTHLLFFKPDFSAAAGIGTNRVSTIIRP